MFKNSLIFAGLIKFRLSDWKKADELHATDLFFVKHNTQLYRTITETVEYRKVI